MTAADYSQWLVDLAADPIFIVIASLASIVSVIVTIAIYRKLSRINAQILLRERSRSWRNALQARASNLAPLLIDQETTGHQIREILVQCRPTLRALGRALPSRSDGQRRVKRVVRLIGRYLGDGGLGRLELRSRARLSDARPIYEMMLEVIQALNEDIAQAGVYRARV